MTTSFTLAGGRVVDPASGRDGVANVQVSDGRIVGTGDDISGEVIDVGGLVVSPGFVDLHVHLREPGGESSETVRTGTAAAAAGGYTAVFAMPNSEPVTDTPETVTDLLATAARDALCDVHPVGAITRGQLGERLVDVAALAAAGVRYLSDDGHPVASAALMREALSAAGAAGVVIGNHSEDPLLTVEAQLNEGEVSRRLGLTGWPHEAEEVMIARDLLLAEPLRTRLHVPHLSTAASVDLVRWAKARGVAVTAEATPHHFSLTDEAVLGLETRFKVNPPLRSQADVDAVRAGLADGTIDLIATDHAPHADEKKHVAFDQAPCGMVGSETALAATVTNLVSTGVLTLARAVAALSLHPARAMGLTDQGGPIVTGAPANLTVFDPDAPWTVDAEKFRSRSHNSPFLGRELRGVVRHTILRGVFTLRDGVLGQPPVPAAPGGVPGLG